MLNHHTRLGLVHRAIFTAALVSFALGCGNEVDGDLGVDDVVALDDPTSSVTTNNLLTNGSFESGIPPWYLNINHGAGRLVADTRTRADGKASAKMTVDSRVGNIWDVAVIQPGVPLSGGTQYTVSFYAKANASGRPLAVGISQAYSPYTNYYMQEFSLSTKWSRYSFTFRQSTSDSNTELIFASGQSNGRVWLDAVNYSAETTDPALTYSPASLDFGNVTAGTVSAVKTLTVTNSGSSNLVLSATTLSGDFTWGAQTSTTCVIGSAIAPGSTCTMAISFAPQSAGSLTGTLTVTSNAPNSPQVIQLAGSGVSAPTGPTGGLITNFTPIKWTQFQIDGVEYTVQNANKSYSLAQIDDHTLRFEIRQGDSVWCCDNEVSAVQHVPLWKPETPITIDYDFMVEPGATSTADWHVAGEMQTSAYLNGVHVNVSPLVAMGLGGTAAWTTGDHLQVTARYCPSGLDPSNGAGNTTSLMLWASPAPLARGQWYRIKIQMNAINNSSGYLYVWFDGTQVVNYHGPLGFGFDTYWLYGLYRHTSPEVQAAQYRNMTVSP